MQINCRKPGLRPAYKLLDRKNALRHISTIAAAIKHIYGFCLTHHNGAVVLVLQKYLGLIDMSRERVRSTLTNTNYKNAFINVHNTTIHLQNKCCGNITRHRAICVQTSNIQVFKFQNNYKNHNMQKCKKMCRWDLTQPDDLNCDTIKPKLDINTNCIVSPIA